MAHFVSVKVHRLIKEIGVRGGWTGVWSGSGLGIRGKLRKYVAYFWGKYGSLKFQMV